MQNVGMAERSIERVVNTRSIQEYWRTAAKTPRGMPISIEMPMLREYEPNTMLTKYMDWYWEE